MEQTDNFGWLELITLPCFLVQEGLVTRANSAAWMISPGTPLDSLLVTGKQEYANHREGCLYLTLQLQEHTFPATVYPMDNAQVFLMDDPEEDPRFQAMALAAQKLRSPLTSLVSTAECMTVNAEKDPDLSLLLARLNRGLYQLQRTVSNMSTAEQYCKENHPMVETNLTSLFQEIFDKASLLAENAQTELRFQNLDAPVTGLANEEMLERAVYNILSNAMKYSPKGEPIEAKLTKAGSMLQLTVTDGGSGIADSVLHQLYARYQRQPGFEDSRHGIGLGMVLIRSAAAAHGGTLLIDKPGQKGTRICLTLALRHSKNSTLRCPISMPDYAGERDHGLLELADVLPLTLYQEDNL